MRCRTKMPAPNQGKAPAGWIEAISCGLKQNDPTLLSMVRRSGVAVIVPSLATPCVVNPSASAAPFQLVCGVSTEPNSLVETKRLGRIPLIGAFLWSLLWLLLSIRFSVVDVNASGG